MHLAAFTLALTLLGAEPADEKAILKIFREEFIAITPGKGDFPAEFTMGRDDGDAAEKPAHKVTLKRSFAIAKYEVTQELWQAVLGKNPSRWKGRRNSVEMLDFNQAQAFCATVTQRLREEKLIDAKQVVRLPTEAEWEYCARAGTKTKFSFGDDEEVLGEFAWFTGNAAGNDPAVGVKKPNAWKLYDVHGYLWEWVSDDWHDNYTKAPTNGSRWKIDDVKPADVKQGVVRGGSWKDIAGHCTSTFRRKVDRTLKDDAVGLRCVLVTE